MDGFWEWFRWLYEATGIKLTIFYDGFDRQRFVWGFLTSIRLMAICLVASVVIGVVGAWLQGVRARPVRLGASAHRRVEVPPWRCFPARQLKVTASRQRDVESNRK